MLCAQSQSPSAGCEAGTLPRWPVSAGGPPGPGSLAGRRLAAWRCTAAVGEFFRVRLSGPIFSEWSTMHPRHGTGYRPQALHVETKCDGGIAQAHAPADVPLTVDIRIRIRPSAFEETAQSD